MGVNRLVDLIAYQKALHFKKSVYALCRGNDRVERDFRYRSQLMDAAASVEANVTEGWGRFHAGDMCRFLRYSQSSLGEALGWIADGIDRGHFSEHECAGALAAGQECGAVLMGLLGSLLPHVPKPRKPK